MTPRRWNQRGNQAHQVVVHVAWVPQSRRRSCHDCADDLILLGHAWVLQLQSLSHHLRERAVVDDDYGICVQSKSLQAEHAVVGLDDHIVVVGEHGIRLNELLRESVIQCFKQIRSETGARTSSDRMGHDEAFQ